MGMKVKVRYADKSLYEGDWKDAPAYEIQTIAYVDPNGNARVRHGGDWYELSEGEFVPHSEQSLIVYAYANGFKPVKKPPIELVYWLIDQGFKKGSFIGPEKWQRIHELGMLDRDSMREVA